MILFTIIPPTITACLLGAKYFATQKDGVIYPFFSKWTQAQQIPGTRNLKKTTSSNIIFKLLMTKEKKKYKEEPEKNSHNI